MLTTYLKRESPYKNGVSVTKCQGNIFWGLMHNLTVTNLFIMVAYFSVILLQQ